MIPVSCNILVGPKFYSFVSYEKTVERDHDQSHKRTVFLNCASHAQTPKVSASVYLQTPAYTAQSIALMLIFIGILPAHT